jgi:YHS domain-containing protein
MQFIDDKIAYFVETYIRLQENSHYQKACVEIDPVCKKSVDCNHSTAYAVSNGKKYFFCSVKCRDTFLDGLENYI